MDVIVIKYQMYVCKYFKCINDMITNSKIELGLLHLSREVFIYIFFLNSKSENKILTHL